MKATSHVAATWVTAFGIALVIGIGCESVGLRSMKIYMQQKNWEKALDQGMTAVAENPNDAEAWFAITQVAAQADSFDLMLRAMDRTLALTRKHDGDVSQIRDIKYNQVFNKAVERYNAGDLPSATERLDLAIRIDSTRANAHKVKGMIYHRAGDNATAIRCYAKAFDADTTDADLGRQYATLLANTGEMEHGLGVMKRLYAANPGNKAVVLGYAQLLGEAKRFDEALSVLDGALAQEPGDVDLNTRAGVLCMEKARASDDSVETARSLEAAVPYFQRALAEDSTNTDVAYNLAMCYRQLRHLDDAVSPLEHILEMHPEDTGSRLQLATIYLQEEQPDKAEKHLEEIVTRIGEPTNAEDRRTLSLAYRYLGIIYTVRGNEIGSQARALTEEADGIRERARRAERDAKLQQANDLQEESRRLFEKSEEMDRLSRMYGE